jgi:hypothetical protein
MRGLFRLQVCALHPLVHGFGSWFWFMVLVHGFLVINALHLLLLLTLAGTCLAAVVPQTPP